MINCQIRKLNGKLLLFPFLATGYLLLATSASAESPEFRGFTPNKYACDKTADDFNPLRPYPGSACDPLIPKSRPENQPISFSCGNAIKAVGEETFDPYGEDADCKIEGDYAYCARGQSLDVSINLADAKLPILGNTENESLSDAKKTNNYLLPYLTGTINNWLNDHLSEFIASDLDRLVSFAGPIRKLLPFDIQLVQRKEFIKSGSAGKDYHNYLAGCTESFPSPSYVGRVIERFKKIVPATTPNFLKMLAALREIFRYDQAVSCGGIFQKQYRLNANILDRINPLGFNGLSAPPSPEDYNDFYKFWNDYIKWSGRLPIPFIGPLDLPIPYFLDNHWAQLFQNVPFSTLEDTVSEVTVSVFDDPRASKQDPALITQTKPWGESQSKKDADRVGLSYSEFNPGDDAYFKDKKHLADLTIKPGSDSTVYVPHVKATRSLADLLASTYKPHPNKFDKDTVSGRVNEHQGINDATVVKNKFNDNSSVIPQKSAPEALFGHTPNVSTDKFSYDAQCQLADIRYNPGDTLMGKEILANLTYTQLFKFRYQKPVGPIPDGGDCDASGECKSGTCEAIQRPPKPAACGASCGPTVRCGGGLSCVVGTCANASCPSSSDCSCLPYGYCKGIPPVVEPVRGFAAVFTKLPFGDELYQRFIGAKDSILRRFLPKPENPQDIKKIAAASNVKYDVINTKTGASDNDQKKEIYWDGLGSILDYILGASNNNLNLQKLLRPRDLSSGSITTALTSDGSTAPSQCTGLNYSLPFRDTSIRPKPKEEVAALISKQFPGNQVERYYDKLVDEAVRADYNPAFVLAIWIEESGASSYSQFGTNIADLGCINATRGDFTKQLACFSGLFDFWSKSSPSNSLFESCRTGGITPNFEDFMLFFSEGTCSTLIAQNRQFCGFESRFPEKLKKFYELIVQ